MHYGGAAQKIVKKVRSIIRTRIIGEMLFLTAARARAFASFVDRKREVERPRGLSGVAAEEIGAGSIARLFRFSFRFISPGNFTDRLTFASMACVGRCSWLLACNERAVGDYSHR